MKRILSLAAAGALLLSLFAGCAARSDENAVPVQSVSLITGVGGAYLADSYAGMVVSGETAEVKKDADKTVLEVRVEEGDMVRKGQVLFTYDTEAMQLNLDKLYLERENLENSITAAQNEITELERERSNANSDQQLSYTLQIDARNADIREARYNLTLKDREIESMEASMEDTQVVSPLAGRVMSVADEDGDGTSIPGTGSASGAFITVMDVSSFRVEGHINELNRGAVAEGMPVLVRSRMDEAQVWRGVVDSIDWEKPVSNNSNNMYGMSGDEMTSSSKYPFYVTLDATEGLLLGQHVYIEPDLGQEEEQPGLLLPGWYIVEGAYVWAASAKDTLEKRPVELGEYDPDSDQYEVLSGLDYDDYIAFPEEALTEGMPVTYYDEASFGGGEEYYDGGDGMMFQEGGEEFFFDGDPDFEEDGAYFDGDMYGGVEPMEGAVG